MTKGWKVTISKEIFETAEGYELPKTDVEYLKKINNSFPETLESFMDIYDNIMNITDSQVTMDIDMEEWTICFTYE